MKTFITTIQIMVFCLFATMAIAQNMTLSGSEILIPPGSFIHVSGNLEINGPVTLNNSGEIAVAGNWINTAPADFSMEGTSGKIILNGDTPQIITGNFNTTFSNLHLQNHAALDIEVMITETLELQDAMLALNKMDLRMMPGAEIQGAGASAYITAHGEGRLIQHVAAGEVLFPVGTNTFYLPALLSNSGTPDNLGVKMFEDVLTGGTSGATIPQIANSVANTWVISEDTPGASDLTLTLWWNQENEGALFDRTQSGIGQYADGEWQAQANQPASGENPFYLMRSGITEPGAFAVGDIFTPLASGDNEAQQTITLHEGWSGISSYVIPYDPNLFEVMAEVLDDIVIMQSFSGIFWPAFNVNTIGNWNSYYGYKVKANQLAEFTISGYELADKVFNFSSGVANMPVLSTEPVAVSDLIVPMGEVVRVIFDYQTSALYWPEGGIEPGVPGALETLQPGVAYLTIFTTAGSIDFGQEFKNAPVAMPLAVKPISPWNAIQTSGEQHFISISPEAMSDLEKNDVIGVFDMDSRCVGLSQFTGNFAALPLVAYGKDITNQSSPGMAEGAQMSIRIFRNGETLEATPTFDSQMPNHDGRFTFNGLSKITSLKMGAVGMADREIDFRIYPNPSNGLFKIDYTGSYDVLITNAHGQVVYQNSLYDKTEVNLSSQPAGIYFVKLTGATGSKTQRIVIR
jgi:hypothetical protein